MSPPMPCGSAPTRARCRRRASWGRRWSLLCWPMPTAESWAATIWMTPGPRWMPTSAGSAGGAVAEHSGKLVLIGFMGAGKTTAAQAAGGALGVWFTDLDHVLEQRLGKPIASVFDEDGEAAFRAAEEAVALELLDAPDL